MYHPDPEINRQRTENMRQWRRERFGADQATVQANLTVVADQDSQAIFAYRFALVDDDGWKVCGATKGS